MLLLVFEISVYPIIVKHLVLKNVQFHDFLWFDRTLFQVYIHLLFFDDKIIIIISLKRAFIKKKKNNAYNTFVIRQLFSTEDVNCRINTFGPFDVACFGFEQMSQLWNKDPKAGRFGNSRDSSVSSRPVHPPQRENRSALSFLHQKRPSIHPASSQKWKPLSIVACFTCGRRLRPSRSTNTSGAP